MALKTISYIFHDPDNTSINWQGYTEQFDDAVISIADKIAEEYDKRCSGKTPEGNLRAQRYFLDESLIISDDSGGGSSINIFNTSADLEGDREVNGSANEYYLKLLGLGEFYADSVDGSSLQLSDNATMQAGGLAQVLGGTIELKNPYGGATDVSISNDNAGVSAYTRFVNNGITAYSIGYDALQNTLEFGIGMFNADTLISLAPSRRVGIGVSMPNSTMLQVRPKNALDNPLRVDDFSGLSAFQILASGEGRSRGNVMSWKDDAVTGRGGLAINRVWGSGGWDSDLVVWSHDPAIPVSVRAFARPSVQNEIGIFRNGSGKNGFAMFFDGTAAGDSELFSEGDLNINTESNNGTRTIRVNPRGILGRGFEVIDAGGGAPLQTDYIFNNVRVYTNPPSAQGDPTLPVGAVYQTTFGGIREDSVLRIKF